MLETNITGTERLYLSHKDWLIRFLFQRLGCLDTAADLTQDSFVRALSKKSLPVIEKPRAYLGKIALGLLANHWRRRDIEEAYLEAIKLSDKGHVPSPEDIQLVMEALYAIDEMLADLPESVRRAFLLSRLDGKKYAEIGETLGVSERTVKKYMARAMLHCLQFSAAMV